MFPSTETLKFILLLYIDSYETINIFQSKNIPMSLVKQQASWTVLEMPSQDLQCVCAAMGFERLWTSAVILAGLGEAENLP